MIPTTPAASSSHDGSSSPGESSHFWKRLLMRPARARTAPSPAVTAPVAADSDSIEQQVQNREAELIVAVFRTLVLLLAVFAPRLMGLSGSYEMPEIWLAALAGLYNIMSCVACLRPDRYGMRRSFIVAMDMLLITLWIRLSGQWELFPFYYLVIVVAAMWFRVLGGALAAAFANFFFLFLWGRGAADPEIAPPLFTTSMALNTLLLFLVGCLVGYMAEIQERERERLLESQLLVANYQREIDLSSQMQPLLFNPTFAPETGETKIELGLATQSARTLGGGDYADAIVLPDGRILLCIADVAGKSVRAQARLPLLKYSLRALAPIHPEPAELVQRLNETLAPDLSAELYIALCCVILDVDQGVLSWCNAGHIAPLFVREKNGEGKTIPLEVCGPPLGMFPEIEYSSREARWKSGDHLLMYTDGLADALSYNGTEDGEAQVHRLAARLNLETHRPAAEVAQDFIALSSAALDASETLPERLRLQLSSLHRHTANTTSPSHVHRDDVTVVVARAK